MAKSNLTAAELRMRGQLGAHVMWAGTEDRTARTQAARRGFQRRFENLVDPDGVLDPAERATRAEHARRAHMLKLALASARARRLRAQAARIDAQLADDEAGHDSDLTPDEQASIEISESRVASWRSGNTGDRTAYGGTQSGCTPPGER